MIAGWPARPKARCVACSLRERGDFFGSRFPMFFLSRKNPKEMDTWRCVPAVCDASASDTPGNGARVPFGKGASGQVCFTSIRDWSATPRPKLERSGKEVFQTPHLPGLTCGIAQPSWGRQNRAVLGPTVLHEPTMRTHTNYAKQSTWADEPPAASGTQLPDGEKCRWARRTQPSYKPVKGPFLVPVVKQCWMLQSARSRADQDKSGSGSVGELGKLAHAGALAPLRRYLQNPIPASIASEPSVWSSVCIDRCKEDSPPSPSLI